MACWSTLIVLAVCWRSGAPGQAGQVKPPDAAAILARARGVALRIDDGRQRDEALRFVAQAACRAGDLRAAREIAPTIGRAMPHDWAIGSIAAKLAEAGDVGGVRSAIATMVQRDAKDEALLLVVQAQARSGDRAGAVATCRQAEKAAQSIDDPIAKADLLSAVCESLAQAGDPQSARDTAKGLGSTSASVLTLAHVARALDKAGDKPGAAAALGEALEAAAALQQDERAEALQEIVETQAAMGDVATARHTADTITDPEHMAWALRFIADGQRQAGDRQGAMLTLQRAQAAARLLKADTAKALALNAIAEAEAQAGDRTAAAATFRQASEAAAAITLGFVKSDLLGSVAQTQANMGFIKDAEAALKTLANADRRALVVKAIAKWKAETGDQQVALAWAAAQATPHAKAYALVGVADGLIARGEARHGAPAMLSR